MSARVSDFRSDTVTQPDEAMRAAIAAAEVGDDVFGDDPTVNRLQARAAELFGVEAALFVPSGTMGNLLAQLIHTRPGDEVICEANAHIANCEGAGGAMFAGVQVKTLPGPAGCIPVEAVRAAIRPDDPHFPRSALLCVENSHNFSGGRVVPLAHLQALKAVCQEHGLKMHIDGARILNAAVASGTDPKDYGAVADTIMCCLSKGLGAPIGSLLLGGAADITRAHRLRKALGGAMRQVGIVAAAGLFALEHGPAQLAEDHRRARALAEGLAEVGGLIVDPAACETNILFVRCEAGREAELALLAGLEAAGVRAVDLGALGVRFVTHKHVTDGDVERAIEVARRLMSGVAQA